MEAQAVAQQKPARREEPVLMPERCQLAEYKRRDWVADVEVGRSVADVLKPSYWAHMAPQFQPYDHIEARADDGKWVAFLIVQYCEKSYAKVVIDRVIEFKENAEVPSASVAFKVDWKGPHYRFAVIRNSDSQMIHSGCKTREEASEWMKNHEAASRR